MSQALIGYFRYMPTTRTKDYSQIKEDDFALLKKEIDEGRPVIGLVNFEDSYYAAPTHIGRLRRGRISRSSLTSQLQLME